MIHRPKLCNINFKLQMVPLAIEFVEQLGSLESTSCKFSNWTGMEFRVSDDSGLCHRVTFFQLSLLNLVDLRFPNRKTWTLTRHISRQWVSRSGCRACMFQYRHFGAHEWKFFTFVVKFSAFPTRLKKGLGKCHSLKCTICSPWKNLLWKVNENITI